MHVGVPETASAQWQQAGRAGRRGGAVSSLAIIIAAERPLDLLYLAKPAELARRAPETANIDPGNRALLILHLGCAAAELKLAADDAPLFGGDAAFTESLRLAVNAGSIEYEPGLRVYAARIESPAQGVSLRGGLSRGFWTLHNTAQMGPMGEPLPTSVVEHVEDAHVRYKLFRGAIFMHMQSTYEVIVMNEHRCVLALARSRVRSSRRRYGSRIAIAKSIGDTVFSTTVRDRCTIRELNELNSRVAGASRAWLGRVHVTTHTIGYVKDNIMSGKRVSEEEWCAPPRADRCASVPFTDSRLRAVRCMDAPHAYAACALGPVF